LEKLINYGLGEAIEFAVGECGFNPDGNKKEDTLLTKMITGRLRFSEQIAEVLIDGGGTFRTTTGLHTVTLAEVAPVRSEKRMVKIERSMQKRLKKILKKTKN